MTQRTPGTPRPRKRPISVTITGPHADGRYHGKKVVGRKPDGSPDRRHVSGQTREEAEEKIRALEDEMTRRGKVAPSGSMLTVAEWVRTWMDTIVCDLTYQTIEYYQWSVEKHIVPGLGRWRLDELTPAAVQEFYRDRARAGLNPGSVHAIHRSLKTLINAAVKHDLLQASPLKAVRAPKLVEPEVTPLYIHEIQKIIEVCDGRRNGTRWTVAMPLGLRQGEALGLTWWVTPTSTRDKSMGLDPDTGFVKLRRKAELRTWQHGCADPVACVKELGLCRTKACQSWSHGCATPPTELYAAGSCGKRQARACPQRVAAKCARHLRSECPPLCEPDCVRHMSSCPERVGGGIVYTDPKSEAGDRKIALAPEMTERIREHRKAQGVERSRAGSEWVDSNLVWCSPVGRPIGPRKDLEEWKTVLGLAGVRDARIHDGRHTAATILLLQGVDPRVVMDIMGWASNRMLKRYQHVVDELRQEASRRVGLLLFGNGSASGSETPAKKAKKKKKKPPI